MKKKTRDLKKHYRNIEKELRDFDIDLSEDSWYRMWHIHLDWDGVTSISNKHRKIHIAYYLKIFEKIDLQTKGNIRNFQTWIYIDGDDGTCDAIYFHTENPEGDFPFWLDNIEWNIEIPPMLLDLLDLSKFNVGKIRSAKENVYSYIIQKKGLGLNINKQ
ncbi:MAG: hypothetical protein ABRQ25_05785 [Clostridiaceae bacterium]